MTKLRETDIQAAYTAYAGGESLDAIAERYGVHRRTLQYRFRKVGRPPRPRRGVVRVRLTAVQAAEAVERHRRGEALDDIAYDLKIAPVTLSRRLRELGHDTGRRLRANN